MIKKNCFINSNIIFTTTHDYETKKNFLITKNFYQIFFYDFTDKTEL